MSVSDPANFRDSIYLDNAATTMVDPRVTEGMVPLFAGSYANASSLHQPGTRAKKIIEDARASLAQCIGASAGELFFTSGGTESNNWALKGIARANKHRGKHIIVSSIEHDCIIRSCEYLSDEGFEITYIPVDHHGKVDPETLRQYITPKTILVSVMHANNEIGTIEPIRQIGLICRSAGVLFHSDACQSFGKIPVNVNDLGVDLLTMNAHKIYGPKGVGALYIRKGTPIVPLLHGGGQEKALRSTTENLPGIAGFAAAASLCLEEMDRESTRLIQLREQLSSSLYSNFDKIYFHGHPTDRLPGHLSFSFRGFEGEAIRLLLLLDESGIAVSTGSACSSNDGAGQASHVLRAIGLNSLEARGSVRVSMGRFNHESDVRYFSRALEEACQQLTPIFH